jgi:hypothetical protein
VECSKTFHPLFEGIRAKLQKTALYSTSKHKYQVAVREAFLALEREANKVGLKINENKTKYLIAAGNERTIRDVGQSVAFGDNRICVFGIPGDTEQRHESGDTEENPDCK